MNERKHRVGWLGTLLFTTASTIAGAQQTTAPVLPDAPSAQPPAPLSLKVPTPTPLPPPKVENKPVDPLSFQQANRSTPTPPSAKKEKSLDKIRHHVSIESRHRAVGIRIR